MQIIFNIAKQSLVISNLVDGIYCKQRVGDILGSDGDEYVKTPIFIERYIV
jgi:hypothetical protein